MTVHEFDGTGLDMNTAPQAAAQPPESLGTRLRTAREAQERSIGDVVAELRIPARIIKRLESDDYADISDAVFLRGYLKSYARLVGVPIEEATKVADAHAHVAPLIATGTISRSRYLFERYSASATYLTLTAIIVVPAVWLATHGGLQQNLARVTPLDPPPAYVDDLARNDAAGTETGVAADAPATTVRTLALPSVQQQAPIIASMAPFQVASSNEPALAPANGQAASTNEDTPQASGQGAHLLSLKIAQPSWVEVTAADGRKLEYAMLAAGSEHEYRSDGAINVRVGNAQGAELRADGSVVDLAPFQRGNVAHLKLFGENEPDGEKPQQ